MIAHDLNPASTRFIACQNMLESRCGLHFDGALQDNLVKSLAVRMEMMDISDLAEYRNLLQERDDELLLLITLLTNNETYFFREPAHLRILSELLTTRSQPDQPLRILSAGCASGEEAYSVAITLLEQSGLEKHALFRVFGVDIDCRALEKARNGCYGRNAFRGITPALLEKYFHPQPHGQYALDDAVKERVTFSHLNLCAATYPDAMKGMDFILFRNVAIYFSAATRCAVFGKLVDLLRPGGCLFLGSAEVFHYNPLVDANDTIVLRDSGGVFYFQKVSLPAPVIAKPCCQTAEPRPLNVTASMARIDPSTPRRDASRPLDEALALARAGEYEAAWMQLDLVGDDATATRQANALKACILLNNQKNDQARKLCQSILSSDPLHPESHLLLGMAARQADKPAEAIDHLKKAVYLRPACWLPHYYLGDSYLALGAFEPAGREYQVVLHQFDREGGFLNHGLPFFVPAFSVEEMRALCRKKLRDMKFLQHAKSHRRGF